MQDKIETSFAAVDSTALPCYYEVHANSDSDSGTRDLPTSLQKLVESRSPAQWTYQPKFSSWSKTELWQVVDVEPMPVFGKFYLNSAVGV